MFLAVTLDRFLRDADLTQGQFADMVGIDASMVTRLISGERKASLSMALEIERVTNGQVSAIDLPLAPKTRKALLGLRISASKPIGSAA